MNLRQIKKNISRNLLHFPAEMYTDTTGSLIISAYMFTEEKPDIKKLVNKWKKNDIRFDDPEYIEKVFSYFNMSFPKIEGLELFMYQSNFNVLFGPVYNGNNLPIREDGLFSNTYRKGKAYKVEL